jgi:hypothetical protein
MRLDRMVHQSLRFGILHRHGVWRFELLLLGVCMVSKISVETFEQRIFVSVYFESDELKQYSECTR